MSHPSDPIFEGAFIGLLVSLCGFDLLGGGFLLYELLK